MTHIVTFPSVSSGLSLVPIPPPGIFGDPWCRWSCSSMKGSTWRILALVFFAGTQRDNALSALSQGLWLCTVLHCIVACVENSFGDDGLEHSYLDMQYDYHRLDRVFKFSFRLRMNLMQNCGRINGKFLDLCHCARHTLQSGRLSRASVDPY